VSGARPNSHPDPNQLHSAVLTHNNGAIAAMPPYMPKKHSKTLKNAVAQALT